MVFKIGFAAEHPDDRPEEAICASLCSPAAPRKSVVQVHFAERNMTLAYYNDQFDLHPGDLVYVDGKLEGRWGCVVGVSYTFKIKISEYKHVIAVADTTANGQFFMAGSHFVNFDPLALPRSKAVTWFKAPPKEDEEFATGSDDTAFRLYDLTGMGVSAAIAERGHQYYLENRVRYLCVDGTRGYAIVEGSRPYEVEFEYKNGEIRRLVCDCFCSYPCKHGLAAMLQLRETLSIVQQHYSEQYQRSGYFAAIQKGALFSFAIDRKETGSFTL